MSTQCGQLLGLDQFYDCPEDPRCDKGQGGNPGTGGHPGTGGQPAATCTDGRKNGDETDVDCGGPACDRCADGLHCTDAADCDSKSCSGGKCIAAACDDGIANGFETDVDCGGSMCGPCAFGKKCGKDSDCATGTCNGATCDGKTIANALDNPNSLAVDDWGVYWAEGDAGTIMEADFATLTPATLVSGRSGPQGLILKPQGAGMPGALYWVEPAAGNVIGSSSQAVPGTLFTVATAQDSPAALAFVSDAQYPFWTANGAIWTYGFTAQTALTISGQGGKLAVVPGTPAGCHLFIYATSASGGDLWIRSAGSCSSNTSLSLATGLTVAGLTADGTFAYWTDGAMPGKVTKQAYAGGPVSVIGPNQAHPTDVAVDQSHVYWINQGTGAGTGAVVRAPINGGALDTLASGLESPRGLFLFGSDVYWISGAKGQGVIKKLPK